MCNSARVSFKFYLRVGFKDNFCRRNIDLAKDDREGDQLISKHGF